MHEVTRNYIKDEDISIDSIIRRLNEVANAIKASNKINLTDINVICEEIFGKILNEIYNINLVSMSAEISGNFIAVDLIDYNNRIAFQVTSRSDRKKIDDTVDKFNSTDLPTKIDSLNILILDEKNIHGYHEPHVRPLSNGKVFSFENNIFDFKSIVELISDCDSKENGFVVKMYDDINMVFDSGRVDYLSIVKNTESLTNDYCYDIYEEAMWKRGYGDIQLTAFIPLTYVREISCLLEIRKHDLAGAYITFNQEKLLKDYFVNEIEFIRKHNVGRYIEEETMCMQIENIRLNINAHAAYHIYQLFSELHKKYIETMIQIDKDLGTDAMAKIDDAYCLMTISEQQWNEILFFARHHDWFSKDGDLEWNIFNNNGRNTSLILSPNVHGEIRGDILAEISVNCSINQIGMLDVYWKPGFKNGKRSMEGFDNLTKWKADYTLDWIKNKLLPKAHLFYEKKTYKYLF
jgi:hypothetical protein